MDVGRVQFQSKYRLKKNEHCPHTGNSEDGQQIFVHKEWSRLSGEEQTNKIFHQDTNWQTI